VAVTAEVLGRDAELVALGAFLDRLRGSAGALVLAGAAGAGKTTLLRAGAALASQRGFTVVMSAFVCRELSADPAGFGCA
jgi:ABC-type transport system involved in cytochrome c biogenesis ATPase subunit